MFKTCTKCGKIKPLNEFSPHKSYSLGVRNICKACTNLSQKVRRKTTSQHICVCPVCGKNYKNNFNGLCGACYYAKQGYNIKKKRIYDRKAKNIRNLQYIVKMIKKHKNRDILYSQLEDSPAAQRNMRRLIYYITHNCTGWSEWIFLKAYELELPNKTIVVKLEKEFWKKIEKKINEELDILIKKRENEFFGDQ